LDAAPILPEIGVEIWKRHEDFTFTHKFPSPVAHFPIKSLRKIAESVPSFICLL
jgi:hypothetical protein